MKVLLDQGVLERIVDDGVFEMSAKFNISKNHKKIKHGWFNLVDELKEYGTQIKTGLISVLVKDFSGPLDVTFGGVKMESKEILKLNEFLRMVELSEPGRYQKMLIERVEALRTIILVDQNIVVIKRVIKECHDWVLKRIELYVNCRVMETLKSVAQERCKLESTVYNFVNGDIPDVIKKLFKNGIDAVPDIKMSRKMVKTRVDGALLSYLERYRSKNSYEAHIEAEDVLDWLEKVRFQAVDDQSDMFYKKVEEGYVGMMAEIDLIYHENNEINTVDETRRNLEKNGSIIIQCDKNFGMSLFTLDTMKIADKKLMEQLGAVKIGKSKEEILESVIVKIEEFEDNLNKKQSEYLNYAYRDRNLRDCKIVFPFLKSVHKVHKMTGQEIEEKNTSVLKFRPIVDAKRWVTRGYSALIMGMLRAANRDLLEKVGPVMGEMLVKNGWRFAKKLQEHLVREGYDIMFSADIKEAYSNVTADMIKEAIELVCSHVGYEEWKIDLMKKIIDLVLSQNYAETSAGLFLFKMILPMGYKLSQEGLNIVALSGEMTKLYYLGTKKESITGLPVAELKEYPTEFVDITAHKEVNMARGVKSYKRYVDDTHCLLAGVALEDDVDGILAVGYMLPKGLEIGISLNIWNSEFLDVFAWKNIYTRTISTLMKRKQNIPIGHVKKGSGHPDKYKLQSLLGEMLRSRRIASDDEIVKVSDECISLEFQSIGYARQEVEDAMSKAKDKIENGYSGEYVKIDEGEVHTKKKYGGSLVYNRNYMYNSVLTRFINDCKPQDVAGISTVPDVKIKNLAYTRKRYLERQGVVEVDKKANKNNELH